MIGNSRAQKYTTKYPEIQTRDLAECSLLKVEIYVICGLHNWLGVKHVRMAPAELQVYGVYTKEWAMM